MHALVVPGLFIVAFAAAALYLLSAQGQFTGNAGKRQVQPKKGTPGGEIVLTGSAYRQTSTSLLNTNS